MLTPRVGTVPDYEVDGETRVPWLLGTQLSTDAGPLARAPAGSRVLLVEAHGFARRLPYHVQKLTLVFAAMRAFRDRLREAGYDVVYLRAETFGEALETYFERYPADTLVLAPSPSHGSGRRLAELADAAGGAVELVDNELFVSTPAAFDRWAGDAHRYRHEEFYRHMRRETGVLMVDGEPVGGEWNYDADNRETPPLGWEPPRRRRFEPDERTRAVAAWVDAEFDTWGDPEGFAWPVTREDALTALESFASERLPAFGDYQDAMRRGEPAMAHSLLSPAINLGLIHPWEAIERVERAYAEDERVAINDAEGFVRQLLGWREFLRHVYRREMPALDRANQLEADRELPEAYWSAEARMACLGEAVGDVHDRGYAHHIQRLMVLANLATLWGVEPRQLNEWFHATFVDAYHWVTTPNVIEMGQYGAGVFATKPYVSSANYVDRMSDYCAGCPYDPDATVGEDACPLNALYWEFLDRNEDELRSSGRMGLMYSHVDRKREAGELEAIRERVARLRELEAEGRL